MFIIAIIVFLFTAMPAHAARITIETDSTTGTVGSGGVSVKAKLFNAESSDSGNSHRENAEFKIRSARDGDRCDTIGGGSDVNGYIYGTCYATQTGSYTIYAHSNDRGDDSADTSLTFNEAPPGQEPTATPNPEISQNPSTESESKKPPSNKAVQQMMGQPGAANTGSKNPLIQDGLAEDKDIPDTGLAPVEDGATVLGENDVANAQKGAPDLLKSLIFVTGALVLLIWSGYLIYLQSKGKLGKKNQKPQEIHQAPK